MEFQAVVMAAGKGSRMTDLTANCPKALLPIGNYPMIWYPLQLLERAGFEEAILIASEASKAKIIEAISKLGVKIRVDVVDIPNEDWGTAESLRHIHDKIKTDILIISCDLVTDVALHRLVDVHRTHHATLTALFTPIREELIGGPIPGYKGKHKIERDFIGLNPESNRLLFMCSEADLDDTLNIRKSLLKKHPNIVVHSKLMDGHLYLMKKWVLEYLVHDKTLSSIKGELVPYLLKNQFSHPAKQMAQDTQNFQASIISMDTRDDIYSYIKEDELLKNIQEMSSWNDHSGDMDGSYHGNQIRCYAYIMDGGFCTRANTLSSYAEANRQIPRRYLSLVPNVDRVMVESTAILQGKAQVGNESMVGDLSMIGDKTSIKRSIIGHHCYIGEKVKLSNCVIMNHVFVEEGSNIQGTIICDSVQIGKSCELKDCLVTASQNVLGLAKISNEVIADVDRMMGFWGDPR